MNLNLNKHNFFQVMHHARLFEDENFRNTKLIMCSLINIVKAAICKYLALSGLD